MAFCDALAAVGIKVGVVALLRSFIERADYIELVRNSHMRRISPEYAATDQNLSLRESPVCLYRNITTWQSGTTISPLTVSSLYRHDRIFSMMSRL